MPVSERYFNVLRMLPARCTGILFSAPAFFIGTMSPCAPAHSALRAMAPKLRTSVTPSNTTISGVSSSGTRSRMSCNATYPMAAICATTPWWLPRVIRLSFSTGTSCQRTLCRQQRSLNSVMSCPSASFFTYNRSICLPDWIASATGRMPKIIFSMLSA